MKKSLLSLILTLVSLTAFAYDLEKDGIYYNILSNKTCEVANHNPSKIKGSINIPSSVDIYASVYTVVSIRNTAFQNCSTLTSVTMPNTVTSIGSYAFSDCKALTSVTIPNSVTSIGRYAFNGCYRLTSVTIPNKVTSINEYTFAGCTGLTSITIPNGVMSINGHSFDNCFGLTSVDIPNSVTFIGDYAFYMCLGLTSVTIPNSVAEIGSSVFRRCSSLTSVIWNAKNCIFIDSSSDYIFPTTVTNVTFGDNVESIPDYLCYGMSQLTSVTIPNSVTSIGTNAFYNCIYEA